MIDQNEKWDTERNYTTLKMLSFGYRLMHFKTQSSEHIMKIL